MLQVIESLAKDGMTIIMVTHEMNFVRRVSERVVFMHQGQVHEVGVPVECLPRHALPNCGSFWPDENQRVAGGRPGDGPVTLSDADKRDIPL